jgi:hypothetical protein
VLLSPSRNRLRLDSLIRIPNQSEPIRRCTAEAIQGSLNTRINILYFLDSLAEASTSLGPQDAPYLDFISRDLGLIVERVVPDTREGVLNLKSAKQVSGSCSGSETTQPVSDCRSSSSSAGRRTESREQEEIRWESGGA